MKENKQKNYFKKIKWKNELNQKWTDTNRNLPKNNENSKFANLNLLNNNINIVSKPLILCAHDNVPCAPELGHINGPNTNIKKGKRLIKIDKKTDNILKRNKKKRTKIKFIKNNREMVTFLFKFYLTKIPILFQNY